jgi:class 3 adenylate cyclase
MAPVKSAKMAVFSVLSLVFRVISITVIVIVILFLLAAGLRTFQDTKKFGELHTFLEKEHAIEKVATDGVKRFIPTTVQGKDISLILLVVGLFVVSRVVHGFGENFRTWARNLDDRRTKSIVDDILDKSEEGSGETLGIENIQDRERLRKIMIEAKKKLSGMERQLAFLSIDVASSTAMKIGEEKVTIEHDFAEYKKLVEAELVGQGALKSAWTPDGVMICFSRADAAVATAKNVLTLLEDFNRRIKGMKADFTVRCGVNAGVVGFDDFTPLEEVSDRAIDIAGHMQKYANPGEIFLAKHVFEVLEDKSGFTPAGKEVDGYEVYSWKKSG